MSADSATQDQDTPIPQSLSRTGSDVELFTLPTTSPRQSEFAASSSRTTLKNAVMSKSVKSHVAEIVRVQSRLARMAFSLCFEEGCILFLLVMCQAIGIFDHSTRRLHWKASLALLISCIVFFIPLLQCLLFTFRFTFSKESRASIVNRALFTLVPFLLYLFALSQIPLPPHLDTSNIALNTISRTTVLGTLILGLLSGFGAISTAWSFVKFGASSKLVAASDIDSASLALDRVRADLRRRTAESREASDSEGSKGWLSATLFGGGSSLQREIQGLQTLEHQMARNLEVLKAQHAEQKFSSTWQGRFWTLIGKVFAIYCVFRIISSLRNLIFGVPTSNEGSTSPDIIAHVLAYLVALLPDLHISSENVASIARQVSLGLVGCIIMTSVRMVLRGVGRVLRVSSRTLSAAFLLLLLAQVMGTYLLSTLIQLRTSFPPSENPEEASENLFTSLPEYQMFGLLFDSSFLAAALITAAIRWTQSRLDSAAIF